MSINEVSKKINVVSQFWPPSFVGGGEISTYITCQELAGRGYEVTILTPNIPFKKSKLFKFIKLCNPSQILIPFEKNYFSKIVIKEDMPKGIYWASDFYGAAYLSNKKVKKIATVRDHWPICINSLNLLNDYTSCNGCNLHNFTRHYGMSEAGLSKKFSRLFSMVYNQKFRNSILLSYDHVVFVSDYIAEKITSFIPLRNYSTIYNPLPRVYIKNNISKNRNNNNILFSGFLKEFKGIEVILRLMIELKHMNKNYRLNVIGYGDLEKYMNIAKRMSLKRQVKFKGKLSVEKIIEMYSNSTFVVVPSLCFETFGRTVIEGMSQGCIVIATNRGGPAEIIQNGQNGFLFNIGDHKQLANIINSLNKNPNKAREIQENARKYAIENFSPKRISSQYDRIFRKMC